MEYVILAALLFLILCDLFLGGGANAPDIQNKPAESKSEAVPPPPPLSAPTQKRKALSATHIDKIIEQSQNALVKYICDGDTVDLEVRGRNIRCRLDSIDCPEDGQSWGDTATYGLGPVDKGDSQTV